MNNKYTAVFLCAYACYSSTAGSARAAAGRAQPASRSGPDRGSTASESSCLRTAHRDDTLRRLWLVHRRSRWFYSRSSPGGSAYAASSHTRSGVGCVVLLVLYFEAVLRAGRTGTGVSAAAAPCLAHHTSRILDLLMY